MDNIKKDLESYIKYLNIYTEPKLSKQESMNILNFIISLKTDAISSNMYLIAELFCGVIGTFETEDIKNDMVIKGIMDAFRNIKNIKDLDETGQEERLNSYLMVLIFLRKLNNMVGGEFESTVFDKNMHSQFEELSEILESIRVIFRIKENSEVVFPLAKLLSEVISEEKYQIEKLDIPTLNTLLLALEVFDTNDYRIEKNKLTQLIKKCNIRFLKYLENLNVRQIGGNNWKNNFKKNGVLILADIDNNLILIRHESKSYFSNILDVNIDSIEDELNSEGNRIASYYEYEYSNDEKLTSFEQIIKDNDKDMIIEALNLIYNKKNYNVFHEEAFLYEGSTLRVVNPFTKYDKYIIKEPHSHTVLSSSVSAVTKDCISKFYLQIIKENGLNCACIGLICNLLEIHPMDISILLSDLNAKLPYQNQIIKNWIKNLDSPEKKLNEIQSKFFSSLRYTSSENDMKNVQFKGLFLYPIEFDVALVDLIINMKYKFEDNVTFDFCKVKYILGFNEGEKSIQIEGVTPNNDNVIYDDNDDELSDDEELYVIKTNENKWFVSRYIDFLGKIKLNIENGNKKILNYDIVKNITSIQLDFVKDYMKLHEKALMSHSLNSISFNSVVKFRLINNILNFKITTSERWQWFLAVLRCHKKVTFENIVDMIEDNSNGVLYVPKEAKESDSVLTSIIDNYLRNEHTRNTDYYHNQLDLVDSEYILRNNKIKKVVILFDTLQSGTSTTRTLDFYFEKYGEKFIGGHPNRTVTYYAEDKSVKLIEILRSNKAKLEVKFINGTHEGEEKIKEYFAKLDIEAEITCNKYINSKSGEKLIDLSIKLYGKCKMSEDKYPIIREFNQPKINAFPDEMLNIDRIFALFVQKKEHKVEHR